MDFPRGDVANQVSLIRNYLNTRISSNIIRRRRSCLCFRDNNSHDIVTPPGILPISVIALSPAS